MMKQPSLLEYRDYLDERYLGCETLKCKWIQLKNYADFIRKDLTLGDFVPCKKELIIYPANFTKEDRPTYKYIPLEKPAFYDEWKAGYEEGSFVWTSLEHPECKEYQQALDRVVYDGWVIDENTNELISIGRVYTGIKFYNNGNIVMLEGVYNKKLKTRQDMVGFEMRENWYKKYFND